MDCEPKIIKKILIKPNASLDDLKKEAEIKNINIQLQNDKEIQELIIMCSQIQKQMKNNELQSFNCLRDTIDSLSNTFKGINKRSNQLKQVKTPQIKLKGRNREHYSQTTKDELEEEIKEKLVFMIQEKRLFPAIASFLKLEHISETQLSYKLIKLELLNDMADVLSMFGQVGTWKSQALKYNQRYSATDLILEMLKQLNNFDILSNLDIAQEIWFTFNKPQLKNYLQDVLNQTFSQNLTEKDRFIQEQLIQLKETVQSQPFQLQQIIKNREKIINFQRKRVQIQLYHECYQRRIVIPEILINLSLSVQPQRSASQMSGHSNIQFPLIMIRRFTLIPELKPFCKSLCLNILQNQDNLNLCVAQQYEKFVTPKLIKQNSLFDIRELILNTLSLIVEKVNYDLNLCKYLKVAILDRQFQKYHQQLINYYSSHGSTHQSDNNYHTNSQIVKLIQTIFRIVKKQEIAYNIQEQTYQIKLPPQKLVKVKFKKHKMNMLASLFTYIKLLIRDLNKNQIPLIEIFVFIQLSKSRFCLRNETYQSFSLRFFAQPHIIKYVEDIYGTQIVVDWNSENNGEIQYFGLANCDLVVDFDDEDLIFQQLKVITQCLIQNKQKYLWAQDYLQTKCIKLIEATKQNNNNPRKDIIQQIEFIKNFFIVKKG